MDIFSGRKLIIATKHSKEQVIAPLLEAELSVSTAVVQGLDTDEFGTFTGEVKRTHSPLKTAELKARKAMEIMGSDLAVGSEGSFGPHPSVFFIPGNEEFVVLVDSKNDLLIKGRYLTTETNYAQSDIYDLEALQDFILQVKFPSHGIIVKATKNDSTQTLKDIGDKESLEYSVMELIESKYKVHLETDMRAMRNPTRMKAIREATEQLVKNVKSQCPSCQAPGFIVTGQIAGLPCSLCNTPTHSPRAFVYTCSKCSFTEERPHPSKGSEDPQYCQYCNP
jgi:hypothetical protein